MSGDTELRASGLRLSAGAVECYADIAADSKPVVFRCSCGKDVLILMPGARIEVPAREQANDNQQAKADA